MMSGLGEQLYIGRWALFDLESFSESGRGKLCDWSEFTAEREHGNTTCESSKEINGGFLIYSKI